MGNLCQTLATPWGRLRYTGEGENVKLCLPDICAALHYHDERTLFKRLDVAQTSVIHGCHYITLHNFNVLTSDSRKPDALQFFCFVKNAIIKEKRESSYREPCNVNSAVSEVSKIVAFYKKMQNTIDDILDIPSISPSSWVEVMRPAFAILDAALADKILSISK